MFKFIELINSDNRTRVSYVFLYMKPLRYVQICYMEAVCKVTPPL